MCTVCAMGAMTTEMQIKSYTYTGEDLVSNHTECAMTSEVQF